jgi:hypothetical protein
MRSCPKKFFRKVKNAGEAADEGFAVDFGLEAMSIKGPVPFRTCLY